MSREVKEHILLANRIKGQISAVTFNAALK
jgi:hypothetical protein